MKYFNKEKTLIVTIIKFLDNNINSDIVNIVLEYLEPKVNIVSAFMCIPKHYHKNITLTDFCPYYSSNKHSLKFVKKFKPNYGYGTVRIIISKMSLLTNVEHIDFSGYLGSYELYNCDIGSYNPKSIFKYCKNLIYLNISNSNITLLPNDLPKLRELDCEDNKNIKLIPYFPNLKILNIRNTSVDIKLDDKYYANEHKVLIKYSNQKNAVNTSDHRLLMYDIVSDSIRFS